MLSHSSFFSCFEEEEEIFTIKYIDICNIHEDMPKNKHVDVERERKERKKLFIQCHGQNTMMMIIKFLCGKDEQQKEEEENSPQTMSKVQSVT